MRLREGPQLDLGHPGQWPAELRIIQSVRLTTKLKGCPFTDSPTHPFKGSANSVQPGPPELHLDTLSVNEC